MSYQEYIEEGVEHAYRHGINCSENNVTLTQPCVLNKKFELWKLLQRLLAL